MSRQSSGQPSVLNHFVPFDQPYQVHEEGEGEQQNKETGFDNYDDSTSPSSFLPAITRNRWKTSILDCNAGFREGLKK